MLGQYKSVEKNIGGFQIILFKVQNECICSEHDVANVLKRFIRQLDEPLLTDQLRDGFIQSANIEQVNTRAHVA